MKILINYFADINENSVNNMINFITGNIFDAQKNQQTIDEIVIQIASNGGSSDHGLLAYNFLCQTNIPKTTINIGNVDSAAVVIYCAGNKRYAMKTSRFTLHGAITTIQGSFSGTKLQEIADLNKRISEDYVKVIAETVGENSKKLSKKISDGYVLDAQESKRIGLVTDILEKPYIESTKEVNALIINNPSIQKQVQQQNIQT